MGLLTFVATTAFCSDRQRFVERSIPVLLSSLLLSSVSPCLRGEMFNNEQRESARSELA
jgi:hypothetical protein